MPNAASYLRFGYFLLAEIKFREANTKDLAHYGIRCSLKYGVYFVITIRWHRKFCMFTIIPQCFYKIYEIV